MSTPLARLLAMAYRLLIDDLHRELVARGWTEVREAFGFVLLALRDGPISLRELVATLGTSKQAVSKLVDAMVGVGLVERVADRSTASWRTAGPAPSARPGWTACAASSRRCSAPPTAGPCRRCARRCSAPITLGPCRCPRCSSSTTAPSTPS
ncbi:MAG TPA: helix-turn-helix domain-containing protein [Pseudonocardia sp.]|nr:helix-turn-helix domain-containing protein [Pseudonocardia sp.]